MLKFENRVKKWIPSVFISGQLQMRVVYSLYRL